MTFHKLTFEEAKETTLVFYKDNELDEWFDNFIQKKAKQVTEKEEVKKRADREELINFLKTDENALRMILSNILLSQEKFLRIVTLIRKLDGSFDKEWKLKRIEQEIRKNDKFAERIADLFIKGSKDPLLAKYLPKFYLERLSLKSVKERHVSKNEVIFRLKDNYIGTYTNKKGDRVEGLTKRKLDELGVSYKQGKTALLDVTVDVAIPDLQDPLIIIMCAYNETTSSDQSNKTRDMIRCYETIQEKNRKDGKNRIFINFVDGGGWLAREKDLKRLVEHCHYFLNINNLGMLEGIIQKYYPNLLKPTKTLDEY
jgi:hypothetical protein